MLNALRHAFGTNVKTPVLRFEIDRAELTEAGVHALIQRLRLRNQDLENIAEGRQREILALLRENAYLKKEVSRWVENWTKVDVRSDIQKIDIKRA